MERDEALGRARETMRRLQHEVRTPVGQIVGDMNESMPVRELIVNLVEQYLEAVERLEKLSPEDVQVG